MRKFPPWPGALPGVLCHVDWEEHPAAKEAHDPGPFLPTGPLLSPRGQPDGTLVAVPVFLLLTSLTCLLFKLSPRSVAKGCVCACVRDCVHVTLGEFPCACQCVCM